MNKYIAIGLILFLCISSCSQEEVHEDYIGSIENIFPEITLSEELSLYLNEGGKPANGKYISNYENGEVHADITFVNGMITEGEIFRSDGLQMEKYSTENNLMKYTLLLDDGDPKMIVRYGDDLSDRRTFNVWSENGQPLVESDQNQFKMWYANGQIRMLAETKDGKSHGKIMSWYANGQIELEHHYSSGEKHGVFIEYDEEGNIVSRQVYEHGELVYENEFTDG